jgi:hypothetical protein
MVPVIRCTEIFQSLIDCAVISSWGLAQIQAVRHHIQDMPARKEIKCRGHIFGSDNREYRGMFNIEKSILICGRGTTVRWSLLLCREIAVFCSAA